MMETVIIIDFTNKLGQDIKYILNLEEDSLADTLNEIYEEYGHVIYNYIG